MSLVRLKPALKNYLWGGNELKTRYHKKSDLASIAESWEVSTHADGMSEIDSGIHKGTNLLEYLQLLGKKGLGKNAQGFAQFPILIKLIDAKNKLSIQVHPDDVYAKKHEDQYGKSEVWYIVDAKPNAFIYYGLNQELTKEAFQQHIKDETIIDYLNCVHVKAGESYFIEPGTIHAIGEGILLCEIQQNSNVTYRVYDYNRRSSNNELRPLHIQKASEVSNLAALPLVQKLPQIQTFDGYQKKEIAHCKYFTSYIYDIEKSIDIVIDENSFQCFTFIEGEGSIESADALLSFREGDTFFVDASKDMITIKGKCKCIVSFV